MNLTQDTLAKKISKSRTYVTNSIRLLKLPIEVKKMVLDGKLTSGHVKIMLGLESESDIIALAKKAVQNNWSVREVERFVQKLKRKFIKKVKIIKSQDILYVEQLLREKLSTKVEIKNKKIIIKFTSIVDLNRILKEIDVLEK